MVYGCPGEFQIFHVNYMNDDLVQLHATFCHMEGLGVHYYKSCRVYYRDSHCCSVVRRGIQLFLDNGSIRIKGNIDDYGVNMIENYLVEDVFDDEYISNG